MRIDADVTTTTHPSRTPPNAPQGIPAPGRIPPEELDRMTDDIVAALKTVFDPEIPADIYELGLIYRVDIDDDRNVAIDMTLTAPGCPVAGEMPGWVENAVARSPGVSERQGRRWSSIRPGTRAACRTRPASPSTCGSADLDVRPGDLLSSGYIPRSARALNPAVRRE